MQLLSPAEITSAVAKAMEHKATTRAGKAFLLSMSGGAYIALGFVFCATVLTGSQNMPWGVSRLLGGLVFSVGLFLVVITGSDLFTSTTMTLIPKAAKAITWRQLVRHWGLSLSGNAVGALFVAALCFLGGVGHNASGGWGQTIVKTSITKLQHSPLEVFVLGIGCNIAVCLGVWCAMSGKTTMDKAVGCLGPVALFVAVGFEHSVANLFMIPLGIMYKYQADPTILADIGGQDLLTVPQFLFGNLLPVAAGNIIGGGVLVGLYYWFIFRPRPD